MDTKGDIGNRVPRKSSGNISAVLIVVIVIAGILLACLVNCLVPDHTGFIVDEGQERVFADEPTDTAIPATVRYIAVGDVVAHDLLAFQGKTAPGTYDYTHIFENMAGEISNYDIASIVQETPFVTEDEDVSGYPTFGTPTAMGDAMVKSGFDVIVAATNHMMDKGLTGINNTVSFWREHYPDKTLLGLHQTPSEADGVTIVEKNTIRIGMTDFTYGLNGFTLPDGFEYTVDLQSELDAICDNIRKAKANGDVDILIAYVHMGEEYTTSPSEDQVAVAKQLIDAGADVVIGSHVHVVQPMEEVTTDAGNTGLVYYSLGNHVSNQIEMSNMLGGAATFTIEKKTNRDGTTETKIIQHDFIPIVCHWNSGTTTEYFLRDYTDELASQSAVPMNVESLRSLWTTITGLNP